jgi:hypothetical protein
MSPTAAPRAHTIREPRLALALFLLLPLLLAAGVMRAGAPDGAERSHVGTPQAATSHAR